MAIVTLSPKYQLVVPKDVRRALRLKPGARFDVMALGSRIECVPVMDMRSARGAFAELSSEGLREERDREP
jgi:AbrB family looped-hinge helix DNA binding protein